MTKRSILKLWAALLAAVISFGQLSADEITQDASKLPQAALEFVSKIFPEAKILAIEIDTSMTKPVEYEVTLSDGTKMEFNFEGNWKEIENKINGVSVTVIPEQIAAYLDAEYKGKKIKSVSKKAIGWEVELMQGLDLIFDKDGKFLGIDD